MAAGRRRHFRKGHRKDGAERLRKAVEDTKVHTDYGKLSVTTSVGVGSLENGMHGIGSPDEIFKQADTALLMAKRAGKNRVIG